MLAFAPLWAWSFEWAVLLWLFMLGAVVGSFLNVVVYRLPRGMSVVRPASRCPACGVPIAPRDNLPMVGWLLLAGRCRACGQAISPRYPLVELIVALLFVALAWYGPLGGQSSRVRVQGFHARAAAASPTGCTSPLSSKETWGVYAYDLLLLCGLIAAGLTELDGQRFTGRLILPTLAIGFFAPLVWPHLRLLNGGLLGTMHAGRLAALVNGAAGFILGWALGWTVAALVARVQRSGWYATAAVDWQFATALAWVGVFLGWQSVLCLTAATMLLWFCVTLAGRLWPGPRLVGPVLCLTACAAVWLLAWEAMRS
ncbi:MAG TPA: prepilin peptidase [Pirellulales bacterium]